MDNDDDDDDNDDDDDEDDDKYSTDNTKIIQHASFCNSRF